VVLSLGLAALLFALPGPARASSEEFSSFDVLRTEEDDESFFDHLLLRPPLEWRDEWARAPQAFRTTQGCFTSGQWSLAHELRVSTPLGRRARFGLELKQLSDDLQTYERLDLWFLFPQRVGTVGVMFRPMYDKSRQDLALMWEAGADSTPNQLRLVFGFEDLFNNLWAWRQSRVGGNAEPYERHPWEPGLKAALRRDRWRIEVEGRWLTPSRKRAQSLENLDGEHVQTSWGAYGTALLEARVVGVTWIGRTEGRQARDTDRPALSETGDGMKARHMWVGELGARRAFGPRVGVEANWLYAERAQSQRAPLPEGSFRGLDRTVQVEGHWAVRPNLTVRLGGLYDRVGVRRTAPDGIAREAPRNESRAYFGFMARIGRLRVTAVEGIELDPESYEVWNHHDKTSLLMQTTF
jgi:hypothetical protein